MSYTLYSQSAGPLGVSHYRLSDVRAPAQFVPTLTFSAVQNSSGTNTNVSLTSEYPIVTEVDGVNVANNRFRMVATFTALRNITNEEERARIYDEHVQFLVDQRNVAINGAVR